jgi:putative transposase
MITGREISFEKSIPYHLLIRAVEKREIFSTEEDCYRFIFQIYAANIGSPARNLHRKDIIKAAQALLYGEEIPAKMIIVEHPPLVNIFSDVLVVTHNHFILIPNVKDGIPRYVHKLKTGFAMYYNLKHDRHGNLFEKPYKIIPIQTNFQLDAVLRYVNVKNVLDVYQPDWKEKGLKNEKEAFKFLNEYQFSSFPDLFGKRNSKILAPRFVLEKYLGKEITESKEEYLNFIKDYLQKNLKSLYPFFLEE